MHSNIQEWVAALRMPNAGRQPVHISNKKTTSDTPWLQGEAAIRDTQAVEKALGDVPGGGPRVQHVRHAAGGANVGLQLRQRLLGRERQHLPLKTCLEMCQSRDPPEDDMT